MEKKAEKVRFLALLLCVAMIFSVFPGTKASAETEVSAEDTGKEERAAEVSKIKYNRKEKVLSGDIAVAASASAVEASACTLVITEGRPDFAIGATSAAVDVGGIRIEGGEITVAREHDGRYRLSFVKRDVEQPASQANILYWYKNAAGEYVYTGMYPAQLQEENSTVQGKISSDRKYVKEKGNVNLRVEADYEGEDERITYEWFAVSKEGEEEELGETGQEYLAENIRKGINRFRCKVALDGGEQEVFETEIVGYAEKISLDVGQAGSINRLIFGEKEGIGVSPESVLVKESYNKKKFTEKKYKEAYKKCLKWDKKSPDKIKLKSYCKCGKLEVTMPGQEEGEKETFSVRLDGILIFPACKFTVKMAKDKKSLTAIFKNVKGADTIQFAVGKKGRDGKNGRKWAPKKKMAQKMYRIGYSQKNGKKIKEKVFFGCVGLQTAFGVQYSDWEKYTVGAKKKKHKK